MATSTLGTPLPFASVSWMVNWILYCETFGSSSVLPVPSEMKTTLLATVKATVSVTVMPPEPATLDVITTPSRALVEELAV